MKEIKTMTEAEKRVVYVLAFGKEYDDKNRKQSPLPLDIACIVAMRKLERDDNYCIGITDSAY